MSTAATEPAVADSADTCDAVRVREPDCTDLDDDDYYCLGY